MAVHVIQKGLDLPIKGAPEQRFGDTPMVGKVAVLARDYPFMKPRMHVQVGDQVKRGQLLVRGSQDGRCAVYLSGRRDRGGDQSRRAPSAAVGGR